VEKSLEVEIGEKAKQIVCGQRLRRPEKWRRNHGGEQHAGREINQ